MEENSETSLPAVDLLVAEADSVVSAVDLSAVVELVEAGNRIDNLFEYKQVSCNKKRPVCFCQSLEINLIPNPDLFD